jgi:uncharacterized protein
MDVTPLIPHDRQLIQGYGGDGFRITGIRYEGSVLVFPNLTLRWQVAAIEQASEDNLRAVFEAAAPPVELLLIGTGRKMLNLAPSLRASFRKAGIMVDSMDTGAACRTYNVLLAEERRVAAALIAMDPT